MKNQEVGISSEFYFPSWLLAKDDSNLLDLQRQQITSDISRPQAVAIQGKLDRMIKFAVQQAMLGQHSGPSTTPATGVTSGGSQMPE